MKLMNKIGIYTQSDVREAKNVANKKDRGRKKNIEIYQLERATADIKKWRDALNYAEDIDAPDRTELIRLYNEVLLDDVVSGFIESMKNRIAATTFDVVDKADNVQEGVNHIFDNEWFDEIIKNYVISELIGYRLLEIIPGKNNIDVLEDIFVFPDNYVIPQWREIMRFEGATNNTIKYDPNNLTVVEMGNPRDYGLLKSIVPLYIYKKNALQYWSNYQSKFGIPPVVAKTNLNDETSRNNMFSFLKNLANNSIGVVDKEDEIAGLSVNSVDGYNTFNELRKAMNEDIQRRLEGQTMTSQEGSSRAQAEVHERTGGIWFYGRLNRFKRLINKQIIPLLAANGFDINEGDQIRFREDKDIKGMVENIMKLKQSGYRIPGEWVEETTGYPVEEPKPVEPGEPDEGADDRSAMKELENLYNSL